MIIPESDKSSSSARSSPTHTQTSFGPVDAAPSPPSYSATVAQSDDLYQDRSHSPQSDGFRTTPPTRTNLPPRCNHLIDRKTFSSVSGTWHVDTALEIPERLLPHITEFDGRWNREAQQTRKSRVEVLRRRQGQSSSLRGTPPPPLIETCPNLMLGTTNGAITGDIHVVSSDHLVRQATLVAEGCNGSINLRIHAPPDLPLRVFASSTNGAVNIKVPSSFEGAVTMSTSWGNVSVSESIKAKFMAFSSGSNTCRGFIGDWRAQGFGTPTSPTDNLPLRSHRDLFAAWTGPLIDLSSTNGTVHLSYIEEDVTFAYAEHFKRAMQGVTSGWFGGAGQNQGMGNNHPPPRPPVFLSPSPPVPPVPPVPPFPPFARMFPQPPPPVFNPPLPGTWPTYPVSPVNSAVVGGLELD
ncbi:hypothetical protein RSOLAG1IB_11416 [Rhizoctonia solani AG-1 IB]|uniref:DUF7330 domain-containing protein n=1 Tax=Thanatephorus cucumeris (strain AG1-IB / isolate 7/3/14) TaxID=1108050 RepID=A0A0B7F995_THACB|nr:hypothetical protein RSOLAG1IB_11416 [Rhizoctonia solani AG-1 IB]